jgi:hypothetical protein
MASIEAHTHHAAGSPASDCVSCHMPKIEQTVADVNVRSHTFRFHHADDDGPLQDSQSVYDVPCRQEHGLAAQGAERLGIAGRPDRRMLVPAV